MVLSQSWKIVSLMDETKIPSHLIMKEYLIFMFSSGYNRVMC